MKNNMAEKKYTAKQLRLTNEEIVEKFAIYWAEVDAVAQRQQAQWKLIDWMLAKQIHLEKNNKELEEKLFATQVILWIVTIVSLVSLFL